MASLQRGMSTTGLTVPTPVRETMEKLAKKHHQLERQETDVFYTANHDPEFNSHLSANDCTTQEIWPRVLMIQRQLGDLGNKLDLLHDSVDPSMVCVKLEDAKTEVEETVTRIQELEEHVQVSKVCSTADYATEILLRLDSIQTELTQVKKDLRKTEAEVRFVEKNMCQCVVM
ncbi:unnamed protein product [Amoebophrya sp. A120]|nr:unnamed protein product [Amoebophrya sp. A120]|eukprot:GSA120T00014888001.1